MSAIAIDVVNMQCLEVISDIVATNEFATLERVVAVLLERYSLPSFDHLRIGCISDVPILRWLISINAKVWIL